MSPTDRPGVAGTINFGARGSCPKRDLSYEAAIIRVATVGDREAGAFRAEALEGRAPRPRASVARAISRATLRAGAETLEWSRGRADRVGADPSCAVPFERRGLRRRIGLRQFKNAFVGQVAKLSATALAVLVVAALGLAAAAARALPLCSNPSRGHRRTCWVDFCSRSDTTRLRDLPTTSRPTGTNVQALDVYCARKSSDNRHVSQVLRNSRTRSDGVSSLTDVYR